MNFIKKKLKSHKKDDEEEEYEKAVYEQSLQPQDQKMKNTEEWQFFQQLSMKVQDTVQKTQSTLNKLKDIRQDSVLGQDERDVFQADIESTSVDFGSDGNLLCGLNTNKFPSAPPRPPPPAAEKPLILAESGVDTLLNQGMPMRAPPRPPPPVPGIDLNIFSDKDLQGSPVRPPTPLSTKCISASIVKDELHHDVSNNEAVLVTEGAFSLLDDFRFQPTESVPQSGNTMFQDLLFLDVKEDTDPFDTSFVDITNISSQYEDDNFSGVSNPFSCNTEKDKGENFQTDSKRNLTNPFFISAETAALVEKENNTAWSAHNPFSGNNVDAVKKKEEKSIMQQLTESKPGKAVLKESFEKNGDLIKNENSSISDLNFEAANNFTVTSGFDILDKNNVFITQNHNDYFKPDQDLFFPGEECESLKSENISELNNTKMIPSDINSECTSIVWEVQPVIIEDDKDSTPKIDHETGIESSTDQTTPLNYMDADASLASLSVETDTFLDSNADEPINSNLNEDYSVDVTKYNLETSTDNKCLDEGENTIQHHELAPNVLPSILSESPDKPSDNVEQPVLHISHDEKSESDYDLEYIQTSDTSFASSFQIESEQKQFDEFSAKFESAKDCSSDKLYDPFSSGKPPALHRVQEGNVGFGSMDEFDPFKVGSKGTKNLQKETSKDSFDEYDNEADFSVVIKPKMKDSSTTLLMSSEPPKLLPPPKTPTKAFDSNSLRFNPFDKDFAPIVNQASEIEKPMIPEKDDELIPALGEAAVRKSDSVETPLSPLFDEDTSMPLEPFPLPYPEEGWEMVLRQPNKKKLTGNRFWKKIFVKLSENSVLQLYNKKDDKLPFQELPLQACYSLSEVGAQQYDQYGKIFTVKLQYKFYRERVGVRPGQISKVTQGQVTSMGDVAKLGLPLQHSPQTSQLLKLGTHSYSDIKFFMQEIEDAFFRMVVHRDRVLTYKTEEVQVIAQDEFWVEQSKTGHVDKQLARVRILFLAFITGMPSVEVGLNDINRQGKEVVGRYDIIPVVTEEWIRLEDCEFHSCINQDEFHKSRIIKFHPPDACLFELLRFRIRPPKNRELPLQVRVFMTVSSTRVEIRSDILVPGYSSRKQGQIPCENIQIRFPIPECWIYLFRTEKHFRYGSKKSTARRPGKIKGLERIIGAAQNLDPSLIEVSAGQAKYEHVFHAVVWRIPRLPKEGQGAYTQQLFLLRTELTSFDQIPDAYEPYVDVEFTMPATYVSHTTVRSVSVSNPSPPEKYVRYVSKHEYKVEIDFKSPDDIDGLSTSGAALPTTSANIQENTEDEKEDENDNSD